MNHKRGSNLMYAMFEDLRDDPSLLEDIPTEMLSDMQHLLWIELAEREKVLDGIFNDMDPSD